MVGLSLGLLICASAFTIAHAVTNGQKTRGEQWVAPVLIILAVVTAAIVWRDRRAKAIIGFGLFAILVGVLCTEYQARIASAPLHQVDPAELPPELKTLVSLHTPLAAPGDGDWLQTHFEVGQTFEDYQRQVKLPADRGSRTLLVQPLGEFSGSQRRILELVTEYVGIYFQLTTSIEDQLPLSIIPETARRTRDSGEVQVLTTHILEKLTEQRRDGALASICVTTVDLYPGESWSYVFGQANDCVAICSLARLGSFDSGEKSYRAALRRALHIASHETCHVLGLKHCVFYECCMNGSDHLQELDRHPLWLCPHCLAKLCHATGASPTRHFEQLAAFADRHGLAAESAFWRKSLRTMQTAR